MNYREFIESKIDIAPETGFEVAPEEINPALKPHQRDAVIWALKGGRRALFESFGLGKTVQQLEFCHQIVSRMGGKALIVCPLGVKQEFTRDAVRIMGYEAPVYVRTMAEVWDAPTDIVITNYERVRDGDINPKWFMATSLDEASVLRSYGSKTYQTFLSKFKGVPYKLVCTATPAPNKYKELIHYAGYLEVMDTGQALTRFFQRDSTKANKLTLYPAREQEFYMWMGSWALFISKPSDLGYDDTGYDMPPLDVRWHMIEADNSTAGADKHGQMKLVRDAAYSLLDAAREKRDSIISRVKKAKEIVDSDPDAHFILWHDLEAERHAIKKAIPEAVEIYGTQDIDLREQRTIDFSDGKYRILATKKELSGSGCNFQRFCHRAIFVGIDYEFNDFIQAIMRIYRYLQAENVIIDIIYTESEQAIALVLKHKWEQYDKLVENMTAIVKKYGLNDVALVEKLRRKIGVERQMVKGNMFEAYNNDCVEEIQNLKDNSVDEIITSIPFGNHYEYSANYNDFGHNATDDAFLEQMDYLTPELLRVLRPGRVYACHVKDRVLFGNATGTGMPTMEPFHALIIQHCMKHGFQYFGMITVLTDVVRENNQTYRLGWTENCKDGTKMGVGCPEYILLFRKLPTDTSKAYADTPVVKSKDDYTCAQWQIDASAFWRSSGDRPIRLDEIEMAPVESRSRLYKMYSRNNVYDYSEHVGYAKKLDAQDKLSHTFEMLPLGSWSGEVWDDINRMNTLNSTQSARRNEKHICPLQIDIVERLINRYSNKGDVILDPFAGLFTVPMCAVKAGRYGIGIELNTAYYKDGLAYMRSADLQAGMPTLFDLIEEQSHAQNG